MAESALGGDLTGIGSTTCFTNACYSKNLSLLTFFAIVCVGRWYLFKNQELCIQSLEEYTASPSLIHDGFPIVG